MKKIFVNGLKDCYGGDTVIGLLNKVKIEGKSVFNVAIPPKGCRDYMAEDLFKLKFPDKRRKMVYLKGEYNWKTGLSYILVGVEDNNRENLINNLVWLNRKEEQAGIRKSTLYETNDKRFMVVVGSKYWKDSCWKQTLYTFYIRCAGRWKNPKEDAQDNEKGYWKALTPNKENILLSKLKDQGEFADPSVFTFYAYYDSRGGVHDKEGFVSICSGKNPPMAKHLGLTK